MKNLLLAILILITANCFAQFNASASAGYGLRLDNADNTFEYQYSLAVTPAYKVWKDLNVGIQSQVINSNKQALPKVLTGLYLSYPIFDGSISLFYQAGLYMNRRVIGYGQAD